MPNIVVPTNAVNRGLIEPSDVVALYTWINTYAPNLSSANTWAGLQTFNAGIDTTTLAASGLITANGGMNVPSGQTLAVGGTITVEPSAAANQPVQQAQVINAYPTASGGTNALSATSVNFTTSSFTAPCNGFLLVTLFSSASSGNQSITSSLSSSLAGLTILGDNGANAEITRVIYAYLPMTLGQSTTLTGNMSVSTASNLSIMITSVFMPNP